jgi:hypothetical protein
MFHVKNFRTILQVEYESPHTFNDLKCIRLREKLQRRRDGPSCRTAAHDSGFTLSTILPRHP